MQYTYQITLKVDLDETDEERKQLMLDAVKGAAAMVHAQATMCAPKRPPVIKATSDDFYSPTEEIAVFEVMEGE